jgi:hypothetical protein
MSACCNAVVMIGALPPTSPSLLEDSHRPYFLWWTTATVADLRAHLADADPAVRAYWMGALLREANTRDVWLFVTPAMIRDSWGALQRHLGRAGAMWAFLLDLPLAAWPPREIAHVRPGEIPVASDSVAAPTDES